MKIASWMPGRRDIAGQVREFYRSIGKAIDESTAAPPNN
jgi:hypothetical protein